MRKRSAPDWQDAQAETAKLFAELGGGARGAYIATAAYTSFLFRDSPDRAKQQAHRVAQESVEHHLRNPTAPWEPPTSGVVHEYATSEQNNPHNSLGNPLWLRLSDVAAPTAELALRSPAVEGSKTQVPLMAEVLQEVAARKVGVLDDVNSYRVMKPPKPREFTREQKSFIEEMCNQITSLFDDEPHREELNYNTVATEPRMPDHVWWEIVRRAEEAGYGTNFRGSAVTITRPQEAPDRSPGTVG